MLRTRGNVNGGDGRVGVTYARDVTKAVSSRALYKDVGHPRYCHSALGSVRDGE